MNRIVIGGALLVSIAVSAGAQTDLESVSPDTQVVVKPSLAILEPTVHNAMPDDNIENVIKRLYFVMLETDRYRVVDRGQLKRLLDGLKPGMQHCAEPFCAAEVGRMLSVDKVLLSDVSKVDIIYELTLKLVDVSSGQVERSHVEKVAGNMNDVAQVGALCAVQALHTEKGPEYQKGDWRKVRAHGPGFRVSFVMPGMPEPVEHEHEINDATNSTIEVTHKFDDAITVAPTAGIGLHYDVAFRLRNGSEIHYTPNVEAWIRWGDRFESLKTYGEVAFNLADFRYMFGSPTDGSLTFYMGLGPTLLLNTFRDEQPLALTSQPLDDPTFVKVRFGGNLLAGLEYPLKKLSWLAAIELKLKLLDPIVLKVSLGLTRPLGRKAKSGKATSTAPTTTPKGNDSDWPGGD